MHAAEDQAIDRWRLRITRVWVRQRHIAWTFHSLEFNVLLRHRILGQCILYTMSHLTVGDDIDDIKLDFRDKPSLVMTHTHTHTHTYMLHFTRHYEDIIQERLMILTYSKFIGVYLCHSLFQYINDWRSYCKNETAQFFYVTVYILDRMHADLGNVDRFVYFS